MLSLRTAGRIGIVEKGLAAATENGARRRVRSTTTWAVVLILALSVALALAKLVHGGPFLVPEWDTFLGVTVAPPFARLLPALACLVLYLLGVGLLVRAPGWVSALWGVLGGLVIPISLLVATGDPLGQLVACTITKSCSGGFWSAVTLSPAVLRDWPALMPGMLVPLPHISVGAPGWPLLFAGVFQALAHFPRFSALLAQPLRNLQCARPDVISLSNAQLAGAWLGVATPLWGALTAVPLYYLGGRLAGPRAARLAVAWWPLVPALAFFPGSLSIPNPFLAATVVALFYAGIVAEKRRRSALLLVSAGIVAGVSLILSLALLPILGICGVFGIGLLLYPPVQPLRPRWVRLIVAGSLFIVGVAVVFGIYWAALGHSLAEVLRASMAVHLEAPHPYFKGLVLDTWDYVLFAGLPLMGLAALYPLVRKREACMPAAERLPARMSVFALAAGGILVALDLSGIARNEVGRVWMFFTPFVLLIAAATLARLDRKLRALAIGAQIIWLLAIAITWWPWHAELLPMQSYEHVAPPPLSTPLTPANALFDGHLRLQGFQSRYVPETRTLVVALHWQALRPSEAPQRFSGVLVGPGGRTLPGVLWEPLAGQYPTTCWAQGQTSGGEIVDQVAFPLGQAAESGDWWLSLRAFTVTGEQVSPALPVVLADGTHDTQVGLGPLPVAP
jgi:hypothetical protein